MSKNLEVKCFFGINTDNHNNESVLEIRDNSTHKRVIKVTFTPVQLTQLLGRMGGVSGKAELLDDKNYSKIGKSVIHETLEIEVPRNIVYRDIKEQFLINSTRLILVDRGDNPDNFEINASCFTQGDNFVKDGKHYSKVKLRSYE